MNNLKLVPIPASAHFWQHAASVFLERVALVDAGDKRTPSCGLDFSAFRVVVPTFEHAQQMLSALTQQLDSKLSRGPMRRFIPPQIHTLFAWREMQMPSEIRVTATSERLMSLYGQMRQHSWLQQLFGARGSTDLLPLAQTLLDLSDELTQVWLPQVWREDQSLDFQFAQSRWQQALAQLDLPSRQMISEETQLVWTLWQAQLEQGDHQVQRFAQDMQIAQAADAELFWISPCLPDAREHAFLQAYARRQATMVMCLDWRAQALPHSLASAWTGLVASAAELGQRDERIDLLSVFPAAQFDWSQLRLCEAHSLEDEAEQAAQTIVQWLQQGKQAIAVIAQDRVVSRRLRALLERAQVEVADETGWKLSTTRAAAALMAWFELLSSRAEVLSLLDFLKSPFLSLQPDQVQALCSGSMPAWEAQSAAQWKSDMVMAIESGLRRHNILGGWDAILAVMTPDSPQRNWLATIARLAYRFGERGVRRSVSEWSELSLQALDQLGLYANLQADRAGAQVIAMLQSLGADCSAVEHRFQLSEWRACLLLQLEQTAYKPEMRDKRVVMLPLNGARLRAFDAVYLIGGDAQHLPSRPQETLFFSHAVRRECGLVTREQRQVQQWRDFAELLLSHTEIVVSWQSQKEQEFNPISPWLAQVNLYLARQMKACAGAGLGSLPVQRLALSEQVLQPSPVSVPTPSAPALMPTSLSASGLNSLMACPYQFFAGRMLKLSALDEFSDRPEKRDYGDWLHAILKSYHEQLAAEMTGLVPPKTMSFEQRLALLTQVSETWFARVLKLDQAALGFSVRWKKVMPAYVTWSCEREQQGWRFVFGEVWAERRVQWEDGEILLRGRLDRIDERPLDNGDTERAVLDYKTKSVTALRQRLKSREDQQLAFYGLLQPQVGDPPVALAPVDVASYVALEVERGKTGDCEASDYGPWKTQLQSVVVQTMRAIAHGANLPAQGVESVCQYCEVRGLCRKGAWW